MPRTERSSESAAAIAVSRTAASATETAIGPAVSWTGDSGTMPVLLTRPAVGLMPTTPQALDGGTIQTSVSVPTARPPHRPRVGFDPRHAAGTGRGDDRAVGLGAHRQRRQPGRDAGRRPR